MAEIIFVDMDEVIVDWRGAACKAYEADKEAADLKLIELEEWEMSLALGIPIDDFWKPINALGLDFWTELEPLPWAQELIDLLNWKAKDNWIIVSSPSRDISSRIGKIHWLANYFGPSFDRYEITRRKHLLAQEGRLLIDDSEKNIRKFIAHGGDGIVFPNAGNRLHEHRHNPLEYLRSQFPLTFG